MCLAFFLCFRLFYLKELNQSSVQCWVRPVVFVLTLMYNDTALIYPSVKCYNRVHLHNNRLEKELVSSCAKLIELNYAINAILKEVSLLTLEECKLFQIFRNMISFFTLCSPVLLWLSREYRLEIYFTLFGHRKPLYLIRLII